MRDKRQEMVKCVVHTMKTILAQGVEGLTHEEKLAQEVLAITVGKIYEDILKLPETNEEESSMKHLSRSLEIVIQELIKLRYARTNKASLS